MTKSVSQISITFDDPEATVTKNAADKPLVSGLLTIFNMMCGAIGVGVLFLPSTLCGGGLIIAPFMIVLVGFAANWTSQALVYATVKSKSKSLEDMFKQVIGEWGNYLYSFSIFFLLVGAVSIYVLLMGKFFNDLVQLKNFDFRLAALIAMTFCGCLLVLKNLKALAYVSIFKIAVISITLLVAIIWLKPEFNRRRVNAQSFSEEFPLWPDFFGFLKAIGSWQAAYLFHMGVSDMYSSLENKSYNKWSRISTIACIAIGIFNLCYAMVGFFATADLAIDEHHPVAELCRSSGGTFLSLYNQHWSVSMARGSIVVILVATFPLLFYFLRQYTLIIIQNIAPERYDRHSETWWQNVGTVGLWIMILGVCILTDNPFTMVGFSVAIFGSIAVYFLPALAWIKVNGGFKYLLSARNADAVEAKMGLETHQDIDKEVSTGGGRRSGSTISIENQQITTTGVEECEEELPPPSTTGVIVALAITVVSFCFILCGIAITVSDIYHGSKSTPWRNDLTAHKFS